MKEKHGAAKVPASGWIRWVRIEREADLPLIIKRAPAPLDRLGPVADVIVGVPARRLATLEVLRTAGPSESSQPAWFVVRRSPIGLAKRTTGSKKSRPDGQGSEGGKARSGESHGVTFDDPRLDSLALAWAKGKLGQTSWDTAYSSLVEQVASSRRFGRRPGSALGAVVRGEAKETPATASILTSEGESTALEISQDSATGEWIEGGLVVTGTKKPRLSGWFREYLSERLQRESAELAPAVPGKADELLADLLGATLVDAQPELWAAWRTLEEAGHPERPSQWMKQAPPWPPASIVKLSERDRSGNLVQTLAAELAPDPDVRAWLLRNWLAPERLINGEVLDEIATAANGHLMREPRFRAWLRAEWTAWARQRYRRVARMAQGWEP